MSSTTVPLRHHLSLSQPPTIHTRDTSSSDVYISQTIPVPNLKTPTIRSRLSKLCQEGQPHLPRQLFDTLPRPTTVIWNTIIIGFICNNMPNEALLFYAQMKKSSPTTKCDSYTYSSTLKACADTRNLKVGKAGHCQILRCLWNPSRIVYNSLLNMYSTCQNKFDNSEHLVRKVFDNMSKRNVVAWNTLVSWYVKTRRYEEGVKQFVLMLKARIKPCTVSFVNVFPALSGMRESRLSNVIFGLLIRMGCEYVNDLFVVSSAICMFAELGCLDLVRKVFDICFERNTEVWNTMIGAYVQNNLHAEALNLFLEAMESEEADLDEVSFLSALTAVSQLQDLKLAQQFHAYIIKHLQIFAIIIKNAIIVMYSRCNCIDIAFKFFHDMPERDVVPWNTMVSAFVQNGFDDEALMLAYEMQKQGYAVDSVTVTALLSAASNFRNPHIGKQTHAYLMRHEIRFEGMD